MFEFDPNRREFVRSLAVGAAGSAALTSVALGQEKEKKADEPKKPDEPPKAKPAQPVDEEVEARMKLIEARFGSKLDDKAREVVRRELTAIVGRARALRKITVNYQEGPFPIFTPYREPIR